MDLKKLIELIAGLGSPEVVAAVRVVLAALVALKRLKGDDGQDVTLTEFAELWAEAQTPAHTLIDESSASTNAIHAAGKD